jgi:Family of unknown function (DUF5724)/Domain of unknown function (DUF4132)
MLKPELAQAQLAEWSNEAHLQLRIARAMAASAAVADCARALTADNKRGHNPNLGKLRRQAVIAASDPKLRAALFAALFPQLQYALEAAWQLCALLPYSVGYLRRGFRAPQRDVLALQRRSVWLAGVCTSLGRIDEAQLDAPWLAAWAVHLESSVELGILLAGAINHAGIQGAELLEIIQDCAAARHPIGGPGQHALRALLCCDREQAWLFVEQLLIAAQRQEGLRQSILEAIDEAHPDAFEPLLKRVIDEDLPRFAAVARAASVWLGEEHNALEPKPLRAALLDLRDLLVQPPARAAALAGDSPQRAYRALWCTAFRDVDAALPLALTLLSHDEASMRFAGAHFLSQCGLPEARPALLGLLDDPHLQLVGVALQYLRYGEDYSQALREWQIEALGPLQLLEAQALPVAEHEQGPLFARLAALTERLPSRATDSTLVKAWHYPAAIREHAADLLPKHLGMCSVHELLPYLSLMSPYAHARAIAEMCKPGELSSPLRELLLGALSHSVSVIREAALKGLEQCAIAEAEAPRLEGLLSRTQADFRRAVFGLLAQREDAAVVASVTRLLGGKHAQQRAGGIELARQLLEVGRSTEPLRAQLAAYRARKAERLPRSEAEAIASLLGSMEKPLTLDDCLGSIDPAQRTPAQVPHRRDMLLASPAAVALLESLDALIESHKTRSFEYFDYNGAAHQQLLGSIEQSWQFPMAYSRPGQKAAELPFAETWLAWFAERGSELRDQDGFELLRALVQPTVHAKHSQPEAPPVQTPADSTPDAKEVARLALQAALAKLYPIREVGLRYPGLRDVLLRWMLKLHPFPTGPAADFLLDAMETAFSYVPEAELARPAKQSPLYSERTQDWRNHYSQFMSWARLALEHQSRCPEQWSAAQLGRLYRLLRWRDEPHPNCGRMRADPELLLQAYAAGVATIEDVYDDLLGHREADNWGSTRAYVLLKRLSEVPDKAQTCNVHPSVLEAAARVRERLVEIELARGEKPTLATPAAKALSSLPGLSWLLRILAALGKAEFSKPTYYQAGDSKPDVLSHLARICIPLATDSPELFAARSEAAIAAGDFPHSRLLELALLNPRWIPHVAQALGWPGLSEAVYWFIAHTPNEWQNEHSSKADAQLQAALRARTQLNSAQRASGLVDVVWFQRAFAALNSDSRWDAIEAAAKFLGWGQAHRKAARLADVLLGRTARSEIVAAIEQRQLKEYVRLLGLLPLPQEPVSRQLELAERHAVLQRYERYAKGLSAMSKGPALAALQLGYDNLAISAGYADPMRLQWAISAEQVADLRTTVRVQHADLEIALHLDADGAPQISFSRAGKMLKSLPAEAKKVPEIAALLERRGVLQRMRSASVLSLEQAMCQGTRLSGEEVNALFEHALLRPLLDRLLLVALAGIGYPHSAGQLRQHDGRVLEFGPEQTLTLAHPLDLLASGDWPTWQRECLLAQRVQPFKQLFRELYVPTAADLDSSVRAERYAGQQVNPRQAMALLASRGWSVREGIDKLYPSAELHAVLDFEGAAFTPTDSEAPTLGGLAFHRRSDGQRLLLKDVPARIFSESLRDLDLVVSVAHAGSVDPEASHSTVEMRAALLSETCALLALNNVRIEGRHALIAGQLGHYSVHLGSGSVHQQPGGALVLVAVQGQHRGRLFLPFADDDPRTAEILSKVLLLARDGHIQDPTVLAQLG